MKMKRIYLHLLINNMKNEETTGFLGERLFQEILNENNISHKTQIRKRERHDFDYLVGSKNIEVKTTRRKERIFFLTRKNNVKLIDYIIGINLELNEFYLVTKEVISRYKSCIPVDKYRKNVTVMDKSMLISFLASL